MNPVKPLASLEAFKLYGMSISLPEDEIEKCYDHYASNGWRVGRNPMRDFEAALRNWKRNYVAGQFQPVSKQSANGKPLSMWDIEKKLEAIRLERIRLRSLPGKKPIMQKYRGNDGSPYEAQIGWSFAPEVQQQIDKLDDDARHLQQLKAQI